MEQLEPPPLSPQHVNRAYELAHTRFVPLQKALKPTTPVPSPVFISAAESKINELPAAKLKKATKISEDVDGLVEEKLVQTGSLGWLTRAKGHYKRTDTLGRASVVKDGDTSSEDIPPLPNLASGSLRAWPSLHVPQRPKYTPIIPSLGSRHSDPKPSEQAAAPPASMPGMKDAIIRRLDHLQSGLPARLENNRISYIASPMSVDPVSENAPNGDASKKHPILRAPEADYETGTTASPEEKPSATGATGLPFRRDGTWPRHGATAASALARDGSRSRYNRPHLRELVTTGSIPLAKHRVDSPRTPETPLTPDSRETIRDVVERSSRVASNGSDISSLIDGESSTALAFLPEAHQIASQSSLRRFAANQSTLSPAVPNSPQAYASLTPPPEGNAFGPTGFWATRGLRSQPNLKELERYERAIRNRSRTASESLFEYCSDDSDVETRKTDAASASPEEANNTPDTTLSVDSSFKKRSLHSRSRSDSITGTASNWGQDPKAELGHKRMLLRSKTSIEDTEDAGVENILAKSKTDTGSFGSDAKRASDGSAPRKASLRFDRLRDSFGTDSKRSSGKSSENSGSSGSKPQRGSTDSGSLSELPFSATNFLLSIGIMPAKVYKETLNKDTHPFAGFDNLPNDDALLEAHEEVRTALVLYWFSKLELSKRESPTSVTVESHTVVDYRNPSERPGLRSKPSRFRLFTKETVTSTDRPPLPSPPVSPTEPISKISNAPNAIVRGKKSNQNSSSSWKLPIMSTMTADALDITQTVLQEMVSQFHSSEYHSLLEYVTQKPGLLETALNALDEEENLLQKENTIRNPDQLKRRTWIKRLSPQDIDDELLDKLDDYGFETVLEKQQRGLQGVQKKRDSAMHVPTAGLRMIWAMLFHEQAVERHELAKAEHELAVAKAMDKKERHVSDHSEENEDDGMSYARILRDIEKNHILISPGQDEIDSPSYRKARPQGLTSNTPPVNIDDHEEDIPPPVPPKDSEIKQRRRKMHFNMGLVQLEPPLPELPLEPWSPGRDIADEHGTFRRRGLMPGFNQGARNDENDVEGDELMEELMNEYEEDNEREEGGDEGIEKIKERAVEWYHAL